VSQITALGIEYQKGCNILVPKVNSSQSSGFSTTFDITAGPGDDSLDVMNPAVHVVANMGDGDDNVNWFSPESTSRLFLQMGNGADTLSVQSIGPVNVDLGDDDKPDYLTVVCQDASPSIVRSTIVPIGVAGSDARLEISHWDSADTVEIARFSLVPPKDRATAIIASDVEGAKIKYQQNDNSDYIVRMCTKNSVLAFTTRYQGFERAQDTNIEIALESYDDQCTITVDGAAKSNGSVMIGVDSNAQVVPQEMTLHTGFVTFGGMNVTLGNVDHVGVSISPAFTETGTLTITGSPVVQDVFVNIPSWKTVVAADAKDISVMNVFGNTEVENLDVDGEGMIISLSSQGSSNTLSLNSNSMTDMTMTRGCLESANKKVLSQWLLTRAKEAGFTLDAGQKCSALVKGIHTLAIEGKNIKTASLSGLGWNSARTVSLPASVENVVVEKTNTETKSSLWTGLTINDNEVMISKKNDDAFLLTMGSSKATVSVGSTVFAPSAKFIVNCDDSNYHYKWNIAVDDAHKADGTLPRSYYTDVNFWSNGKSCSGRINSKVFASLDSAPSVHLSAGIVASVLVETSGTKDATLVARYVNLSNSDGMNRLRLRSFDRSYDEAEFVWDATLGDKVTVHLGDRSENSFTISPAATVKHAMYVSADVHSALSFPNLGNSSIAFEGVHPAHFNSGTKSFDLLGGKSVKDDVFCFSPCDMCSAATWEEIRVLGKPCSIEKTATATCTQSARVHVAQNNVPALLSVSCSKAKWDPTKDAAGQCSIAFNANGAEGEYTNVIPSICKTIAAIIAVAAAGATVACASVLISRLTLAFGKTAIPNVNTWWLSNLMRDFFNDQFSWASIVLTACLGGISNFDISNWGGPVDGLVIEIKSLVFDWLNFCDTAYSPIVIITWVLSVAAIVMRILTGVGAHKDTLRWRRALRFMNPAHAVLSSVTLLVLPFAGFAIPVLMSVNVFAGIMTLLCAVGIIASIPIDKFNSVTRVRVIASFIAVSVPFLVSIMAGAGVSRAGMLSAIILSVVLLPLCNTFVLWKLFFAGADTRTKAWKRMLFWTFGLRALSMISGVIFMSTLFFMLNATASGFAYAFWFLWVMLPPFQLIPLVVGAKSSNIVPRDFRATSVYTSINGGETTPLRADSSLQAASLNSIQASDKLMSDVASA